MSQQKTTPIQKAMILCGSKEIVAFTKAALKPFHFQEVDSFENGIDAIKRLGETSYDLVICHNKLKFISGWNFIKEMKISDRIPNMAAILMGDGNSPASENELLQYGLMNYLKTPMNESQLSFRIHSTFQLFKTSGTVENKFSKAKAALLGRKSELAVELYSELQGLTKKSFRSSLGLAESLVQKDEEDKAEGILSDSIKANGALPPAIFLQIKIHLKKKRLEEARKLSESVLKSQVESPYYHSRLLNLYIEANQLMESEGVCIDAIKKQFHLAEFWQALARIQYQAGKHEESLRTLDAALKLFGPRAELLNIKGASLRKMNRLVDALQTYEEALAIAPMDSKVYYNMALCFLSQKNFSAAQKHLEICLKITPNFSSAREKQSELTKFLAAKGA